MRPSGVGSSRDQTQQGLPRSFAAETPADPKAPLQPGSVGALWGSALGSVLSCYFILLDKGTEIQ